MGRSPKYATQELAERLRARQPELKQMIAARATAISGATEAGDVMPDIRPTVEAAVRYGIALIERKVHSHTSPPAILRAGSRAAARSGVRIEVLLRQYVAGYAVFTDCLARAADEDPVVDRDLVRQLLVDHARHFEALLAEIGQEHERAAARQPQTLDARLLEMVRRVLGGEPVDLSEFGYQLEGYHLGLVASGDQAPRDLKALFNGIDANVLVVPTTSNGTWIWLGGRQSTDPEMLASQLTGRTASRLGIGEPADGRRGWSLTHRQARAAERVATLRQDPIVRYSDSMLTAAAVSDDLLAESLLQRYVAPLEQEADGGEKARNTLLAYLATGQNTTSAAAMLGVTARTVTNRLRALENAFGGPIGNAAPEIAAALQLWRNDGHFSHEKYFIAFPPESERTGG